MSHWREEYFQTLREAAVEAGKSPEWVNYAAFCLEYERGLRQQALATLEGFIASLARAPFEDRRRFVSWLMHHADGRPGEHMLVPHTLNMRVIQPTLLEWTELEPGCSEPHRWLGGYEHLKRAVELDPKDELAIRKLVLVILNGVGFSTHELPVGYLGRPQDDLAALSEAEVLLHGLSSDDERSQFGAQILGQRTLIQKYLRDRTNE